MLAGVVPHRTEVKLRGYYDTTWQYQPRSCYIPKHFTLEAYLLYCNGICIRARDSVNCAAFSGFTKVRISPA